MKIKEGKNNISYVGPPFKEWFGDMEFNEIVQMEPLISEKLPRSMNDSEILAELKPQEVTLSEAYYTVQAMDKDVWALFYIKDKDNVLRVVRVYWGGGGWGWGAGSVLDPREWFVGSRVFSRNFSDTMTSDIQTLNSSDSLTLKSAIELVKKKGYKVIKEM